MPDSSHDSEINQPPVGDTTVAVQSGGRMLVGDRYELVEEIGKGGMGIVYLALDRKLNRYVALKRLITQTKDARIVEKRFLREAQTIASLGHANIVNVYDICKDETGLYIIMEYVAGPPVAERDSAMTPPPPLSVEQYVKMHGPFSPDDCRQLLCRLALALDYAHRQGVIHRDIKPANILLNAQFEPKLVDFGLAMPTDRPESMELTRQGALLGTPDYAAPEQWTDAATADGRSDLYSLAASSWYMLTGESPRYFREKLIPEGLRQVICRAYEKDRTARYADAHAFYAALQASDSKTGTNDFADATVNTAAGGMWVCNHCGAQNLAEDDYCRGCGVRGSRECLVCTARVDGGSHYCPKCGSDADSAELTAKMLSTARFQAEVREYDMALLTIRELPGEISGDPGKEVRKWRQASLQRRNLLTDLETTIRSCNHGRATELHRQCQALMPVECLSDCADFEVLSKFRELESNLTEQLQAAIDRAREERNLARYRQAVDMYSLVHPGPRARKLDAEVTAAASAVDHAVAQAGLAIGFNCVSRALAVLHSVPPWRGGELGDRRERLESNLANLLAERDRALDEIDELMTRREYDDALRAFVGMNRFRLPKTTRDVEPDEADKRAAARLAEFDRILVQQLLEMVSVWITENRWQQLTTVRDLIASNNAANWKRLGEHLGKLTSREVPSRFDAAVQLEQKGRFQQAEKAWASFALLPEALVTDRLRRTANEFPARYARHTTLRNRARNRRLAIVLVLLWGYPLARTIGQFAMTAIAGSQITMEMVTSLWPQPVQFLLFAVAAAMVLLGKDNLDTPFRHLPRTTARSLALAIAACLSPASWLITDCAAFWLPRLGNLPFPAQMAAYSPLTLWLLCDLMSGNRMRPPAGISLSLSWIIALTFFQYGLTLPPHLHWLACGALQSAICLLLHLTHRLLLPGAADAAQAAETAA